MPSAYHPPHDDEHEEDDERDQLEPVEELLEIHLLLPPHLVDLHSQIVCKEYEESELTKPAKHRRPRVEACRVPVAIHTQREN